MSFTSTYPVRNFMMPSGYVMPDLTTDVFTNPIIDSLYTYFSACFGQMTSQVTQNQKRGIVKNFGSQIEYLLMSLYVLRQWYNGSFTIINPVIGTGINMSIYFTSGDNIISTEQPLILAVNGISYSILVANINLLLPLGYSATLNSDNSISIITLNPSQVWFYVVINNGVSNTEQWSTLDINSCPRYRIIQNIIENCIKICGNSDCKTLTQLETDNVYTSLGLNTPIPISGKTNYTNFYFN